MKFSEEHCFQNRVYVEAVTDLLPTNIDQVYAAPCRLLGSLYSLSLVCMFLRAACIPPSFSVSEPSAPCLSVSPPTWNNKKTGQVCFIRKLWARNTASQSLSLAVSGGSEEWGFRGRQVPAEYPGVETPARPVAGTNHSSLIQEPLFPTLPGSPHCPSPFPFARSLLPLRIPRPFPQPLTQSLFSSKKTNPTAPEELPTGWPCIFAFPCLSRSISPTPLL